MLTFGDRLRAAMGSMTIREVARAAGLHEDTVLDLLHGRRKGGPTLDTVERLARATRTSPATLGFGGEP